MANSNDMARSDADKSHIGASMLVLDALGDIGKLKFSGMVSAWVNFDGTGSISIRGSANVSSVTDNGTGSYTINFTDNISPDANGVWFCYAGSPGVANANTILNTLGVSSLGVTTVNINTQVVADFNTVLACVVR